MLIATWDELRKPATPRDVRIRIPGIGMAEIAVTQSDIDAAHDLGGNPRFELIEVTAVKNDVPHYRLGCVER